MALFSQVTHQSKLSKIIGWRIFFRQISLSSRLHACIRPGFSLLCCQNFWTVLQTSWASWNGTISSSDSYFVIFAFNRLRTEQHLLQRKRPASRLSASRKSDSSISCSSASCASVWISSSMNLAFATVPDSRLANLLLKLLVSTSCTSLELQLRLNPSC